jgi:hypothetical protein
MQRCPSCAHSVDDTSPEQAIATSAASASGGAGDSSTTGAHGCSVMDPM